ncbi:Oidioi.mRNA.OKI2018_I69.chr1.g2167.t1.cds [Oikopleura dioica]|uniref:Oidioi.mRNA.OKI2018_I69.chr1.g2167.t1.cds n=1 Tax=Oikopleura dioica TaxID=34765 RepID=A0ABN7SVK7_OIKDI|nr:Oidioi.mRNA.OKI2018_I69.chr1.g2167.t1.cds [Oikopleura dioica]
MGNCAGKPKTKEPPVSSRAKIESPRQPKETAAQKQNKPATPPKTEVDQRGPRPDPFTKTSSETKWITPTPKKPEVIVEPEPEPVAEPEPEPVIEQVIDQPEQAQQTSADIAVDDDQKEIDANAVNDFADALSDSCKRVALEEIDIQKDEVEGETIITPDFVEETLIQPIKREDSMKNRIEGKTLADYTKETPIEKVTEATQEVEAFIEEEFIAPVERQESLKDRIEGKTFEEYQKAQEEAEDLADVGKEIEAALNELESSQVALDSVRQANLEATIEAVTKPFESAQQSSNRAQTEIKDEYDYVQNIGSSVEKFKPAEQASAPKSIGPQYSSLADAPIIYDDLEEEYFSAQSSVPTSTKFDSAESRDIFSNETSRNDELEDEEVDDEIVEGGLNSNSFDEELEGEEKEDLLQQEDCGIMEDQQAPSIHKIHLKNVIDTEKDETAEPAQEKPKFTEDDGEPGNLIEDYEDQLKDDSSKDVAKETSKADKEKTDETVSEIIECSTEATEVEEPVEAVATSKEDIVHHGFIEIIPKDGSEIITKEYEIVEKPQSDLPEEIADHESEALESTQTDVEDLYKTEASEFPTEMDILSEPDSREAYHPLESMIRHLSLDVNMDEAMVPENLEPIVQFHEESKCKETLDKLALTLADDFENQGETSFREIDEPEIEIEEEKTPKEEADNSGRSEFEPIENQSAEEEEPETQVQGDQPVAEEKVLDAVVEEIFKKFIPNPEAYVPVYDYSRPALYEQQVFEKTEDVSSSPVPKDDNRVTQENIESFFRSVSQENVNAEPKQEEKEYTPVFYYSRPSPVDEDVVASEVLKTPEIVEKGIEISETKEYTTVFDYSRPSPYDPEVVESEVEKTVEISDSLANEDEKIQKPEPAEYKTVFDYSRPSPYDQDIVDSEVEKVEPVMKEVFEQEPESAVSEEKEYSTVFDYSRPTPYDQTVVDSEVEKPKEEESKILNDLSSATPDQENAVNPEVSTEEERNPIANYKVVFDYSRPSPFDQEIVDSETVKDESEVEHVPVFDYSRPAPFDYEVVHSETDKDDKSVEEEAQDLQNNDECEYEAENTETVEVAQPEGKPIQEISLAEDFEDPVAPVPIYDAVDLENNDEPFEVIEQEYIPVYDYSRPAPAGDLIMVKQDESGTKIFIPEIGTDEINVKTIDLENKQEEIDEPVSAESIEPEIDRPTAENVENFFRSISRENINEAVEKECPLDKIAHQLSLDVDVDQVPEPKEEIYKVKEERNDEDIDRFASEMVKQVLASDDLLESDKETEENEENKPQETESTLNENKLSVSVEKVREDDNEEKKSEPPTPDVEVWEIDNEFYVYEKRKVEKYLEPEKEKETEAEQESEAATKQEPDNFTSEKTEDAEELYAESSADESSADEEPAKRVSFSDRPAELIGTQVIPTETIPDLPPVDEKPSSEVVAGLEKEEETPTFEYSMSPEVKDEQPVFDLSEPSSAQFEQPEIVQKIVEGIVQTRELDEQEPVGAVIENVIKKEATDLDTQRDLENNDELDYKNEAPAALKITEPEVIATEDIIDTRKLDEQDVVEEEVEAVQEEPDLENNDEKEYVPVFDYSRPAPQEDLDTERDLGNNDEIDYENETPAALKITEPEVIATHDIPETRKLEEQDDVAEEVEATLDEPDLQNNDEKEYLPVFDYSRPATIPKEETRSGEEINILQEEDEIQEEKHQLDSSDLQNEDEDDLEEPESLEHLTQDQVENFFKSVFKPPVQSEEPTEPEEELSLSDEERALEEEIRKAQELEQLERQLDTLENQYLDGEEAKVALPRDVETFIEKLRATTPPPPKEPTPEPPKEPTPEPQKEATPEPPKDPKDMTLDERLKMINKDVLELLEPADVPVSTVKDEEVERSFGCRVESEPKLELTPEPAEIELQPEIELEPEVVLEPEVEEESQPDEKRSKLDNEITSVYSEYSTAKNKKQLESFYAVKLGDESPKQEDEDQAELELECQEIPSSDNLEDPETTPTKSAVPVQVQLDVDVDTIEEEDEEDEEPESELVAEEQVVSNQTSVHLLTDSQNESLKTELTQIDALQESEPQATATEEEVKPEVIEPAYEVSEAPITARDDFIQPQMEKQDSEEVSEEIVADSVTDKSIEFENEEEQSEDKSEETEDKSQETVVEAPFVTPKVAFSEPEIPKSVGFAEPEPVVELQGDFESSFIDRIAEEMINSIILEATRIVEIDQQNDTSEKDDSDPFQVSQSSKISIEDNIDDDISIPTDDELEHVSDDEIKVRQLSTDSTDELLNVPSPLARPDEPSPTVMTPAVLKTPDSQTFFPENDQSSEPGDNIYDFVEDELEPGDDIHGLIDSARASREASLKGSQRSINKLVQSIDDDVPDIYSKPDRPSTPERIVDQLQDEASKAEEPVTIARKSSISVSMEALEREGSPTRVEINVAQQSPQILKHTINVGFKKDPKNGMV